MTFEELVEEVAVKTNRPDMGFEEDGGDGRIPRAVRTSLLTMHNKDYFYRDIQPAQVVFDTPSYIQLLDVDALPRYKSIAYIRKWDSSFLASQSDPTILPPLYNTVSGIVSANDALAFIEIIDPSNILDGYGIEKQNVGYQINDAFYIKSSTAFQKALYGFYQFPILDIANKGVLINSWIAKLFPFAITMHAASAIFTAIGQQDVSRKMDSPGGEVAEQVEELIKSNVSMRGY